LKVASIPCVGLAHVSFLFNVSGVSPIDFLNNWYESLWLWLWPYQTSTIWPCIQSLHDRIFMQACPIIKAYFKRVVCEVLVFKKCFRLRESYQYGRDSHLREDPQTQCLKIFCWRLHQFCGGSLSCLFVV